MWPEWLRNSTSSQVTDGCGVVHTHYNGSMTIVEIAFFSAAAIMGVITAVAIFTLIKHAEQEKRESEAAEDEATR